jgi:hypothetical protein
MVLHGSDAKDAQAPTAPTQKDGHGTIPARLPLVPMPKVEVASTLDLKAEQYLAVAEAEVDDLDGDTPITKESIQRLLGIDPCGAVVDDLGQFVQQVEGGSIGSVRPAHGLAGRHSHRRSSLIVSIQRREARIVATVIRVRRVRFGHDGQNLSRHGGPPT